VTVVCTTSVVIAKAWADGGPVGGRRPRCHKTVLTSSLHPSPHRTRTSAWSRGRKRGTAESSRRA
jgi:hypothetical protein